MGPRQKTDQTLHKANIKCNVTVIGDYGDYVTGDYVMLARCRMKPAACLTWCK